MSSRSTGLLDQLPLFAELSPNVLAQLATESRVRRYPEGQVLFSEGDPGDMLMVLEEGRVKVSRFTPGGQEVVLAVQEAPASFGELALIDGAPRSATITAQSAITIRMLPRTALMGLVQREPSVALALLRTLNQMVRDTNERLSDIVALDVPGRVAKWICTAADRTPRHSSAASAARTPVTIPLHVSQGELATQLGTTRVSVNKALKSFEGLGLIELGRDAIVINDLDGLRDYTLA